MTIKKKLIIGLISLIVLIFGLWWRYSYNQPRIVDYFPSRGVGLFDFVRVEFSRPISAKMVRLEVRPPLKISVKQQAAANTIRWRVIGLPKEKTTYNFSVFYKNKLIKTWQMTPPPGSTGVGIYPVGFEKGLEDYVKRTPILQNIPTNNPYFRVKYYSESYLAIYLLGQDKNRSMAEAKRWLDSLPGGSRTNLKIDWVK